MFTKFIPPIFVQSGISSEAKSLIETYQAKRSNIYIWYEELGRSLLNYLDRVDLIEEVFRQLSSAQQSQMLAANVVFVKPNSKLDQSQTREAAA